MFRVTYLLLSSQYVCPEALPVHRCKQRSGMGLTHSGDIANLCFIVKVESKVFTQSLGEYGILAYKRYFDDCFFAFQSLPEMRTTLRTFFNVQSYFRIIATNTSPTHVQFLELDVTNDGEKLLANMALRKQPIPLCPTSSHSMSIHRAWPRAVLAINVALCDDKAATETKTLEMYSDSNSHPFTLQCKACKSVCMSVLLARGCQL